MGSSIFGLIYVIIGFIIANDRGYLTGIGDISSLLSALFAILLWPLLFFGISLNISLNAAMLR